MSEKIIDVTCFYCGFRGGQYESVIVNDRGFCMCVRCRCIFVVAKYVLRHLEIRLN